MRAHLKTAFWCGLLLSAGTLAAVVVVAPFWAVFSGSDVDLGPIRVLATIAMICLYGWTALVGVEIRGPRPRASLLASIATALSAVGLLAGLLAVWPVGAAADDGGVRWLFAGGCLALTLLAVAAGLVRRRLEG
jgi:hypothetical protein